MGCSAGVLVVRVEIQGILMPPRLSCHPVHAEAPMDVGTIVVLVAVNAYFGYQGIRAWKEARRFGSLMKAGLAAGAAAIAIGQVAWVLHDKTYATWAIVVACLCPVLVIAAIWPHLGRPR